MSGSISAPDPVFISSAPNPFNLPTPSPGWLKPIAEYDSLLRIVPSQKHPVYRLMRVARRTGKMLDAAFSKITDLHVDTRLALQLGLVAVTTLPAAILTAPPEHVVQWLKDHDLEAHGGADRVADRLEQAESRRELIDEISTRSENGVRHRASRVSYLYRTGARVSLICPPRAHPAPSVSPLAPDSSAPAPE